MMMTVIEMMTCHGELKYNSKDNRYSFRIKIKVIGIIMMMLMVFIIETCILTNLVLGVAGLITTIKSPCVF